MALRKSRKRLTKQERALLHRRKMRRRIILLVVEILLLFALGAIAYAMSKLDKLDFKTVNKSNLEIYQDTGEFTNIALFGLDSREGELEDSVRSDCIMVASINNKTKEVKIVSVFRDTLSQQEDGTYEKANSAYAFGGPEEAIALLNRNFDLDIQKYMSVDFNALADVIDLLGGIELELTAEEVFWTNGYCTETAQVVGRETTELTTPGKQVLDGIQAVSFARIRYTDGDDFKRSERQRTVLQKVVEEAKKASIPTLNKIIDQVLPQVSTNLSTSDFLGIAASATKYKISEMSGFPFDVTTSESVYGLEGSYVVPIGFADNVKQLHKFLFGHESYGVSAKVQEIDSEVTSMTGISSEGTVETVPQEETIPQTETYTEQPYVEDYSSGTTGDGSMTTGDGTTTTGDPATVPEASTPESGY